MRMRKGFTLIELLIVLAIIAALMAVVTPIALNAVKKAKITKVAENLRNIKSAVESYVYTQNTLTLSDLTIDTLAQQGYLSNADLSNYGISSVSAAGGVAYVLVYYKGTDVTLDELDDVLPGALYVYDNGDTSNDTADEKVPEASSTSLPTGKTLGTDAYVGLVVKLVQWW